MSRFLAASEAFDHLYRDASNRDDVYRQQTPTPGTSRTRAEVEQFFTGLEMVDPGVVRLGDWRPDPAAVSDPGLTGGDGAWAGIGRKI